MYYFLIGESVMEIEETPKDNVAACLWFPRVVDCLVGEPLDMAEGRNIDCRASMTEDRVPRLYLA